MSAAAAASNLSLSLPVKASSVTSARHAATEWAAGFGIDTWRIALAISEAVGNAVAHAYKGRSGGTIEVRGEQQGERLVLVVSDDGLGMRPNLGTPGLGMGISLIGEVSTDLQVDSSRRGTTVSMGFALGENEGGLGR
jgi:anti-sigma regulatory factor (Ser/Thr protein kinase)